MPLKYPKTPYWPHSPSIAREDRIHPDPERFVGVDLVITEKLDGSNILLHQGEIYARSVSTPSTQKWMAMAKKHHAYKVQEPTVFLNGEELYGIHSIEYGPMAEHDTLRAFALRNAQGDFTSFKALQNYVERKAIRTVPILWEGQFDTLDALERFIENETRAPSALGGEREGVVIRLARAFPTKEFPLAVCKSVRPHHVRTDRHWTRDWRPCALKTD